MTTQESEKTGLNRRALLKTAGAAALAVPLAGVGLGKLAFGQSAPAVLTNKPKLVFATNAAAPCLSPVYLAKDKGIYDKYGLDVTLLDFGGPTEQLLEALATGKADAGIGMALRWLKPLEAGFDVKITTGAHGGCARLVTKASTGLRDLKDLKGKTIGITDLNSPGRNFFAIQLHQAGIDPVNEVDWKQFPIGELPLAIDKGEIHAIADGDPNAFLWLKQGGWVQISSNLDHGFADRVCCIAGIRGSLIRDDPKTAAALTRSVLEANDWTVAKPDDAALSFAKYAPAGVTADDIIGMLNGQTHNHHPTGADLKKELALYAGELKEVGVFKQSTDPDKFADKIYADVLSI